MIIEDITLRRILDSRGNPTVEADITTASGFGRAAAPTGASTGTHEAQAWPTEGVAAAIELARQEVVPELIGVSADEQAQVDALLHEVDSTANFSRIGGNLAVAISLATARAAAASQGVPLFRYVAGMGDCVLPAVMGNVLGGGAHAVGGTDIQEFLVTSFDDDVSRAIDANTAVHREVGAALRERFPDTALGKGDEGAWVAPLENVAALELVVEAAQSVADETGVDIRPGLDLAASEFYRDGKYHYRDRSLTPEEQVDFVVSLIEDYSLHSVEDPLDQEDFESWAALTARTDALVIGDDLYVTNVARLAKGIELEATNAILIKPNQIGTLTDTIATVALAREAGLATVISHRSGETTDTAIAHLGVAFGCHAIKTGAVGGERIAKLNELVRIAGELR
ncbi:MAG: phosphopyruvate hydratase [Methanobacteriota archaeon]|uniref:Enolase n=1 Tax=Marine Group III euryarchaeote TaxID=2173149 RepID=A0A7C8DN58_9ARCH|nr:MAG: phosphopyruvate hydratase [Euryarchaeota archaeon]HIG63531.1 phosphopyruvate hydratase [Marine Group III euryarchaeote]HIL33195.1 phosphopyruvate hydratase [Candidatus Poseidoniales archaeon]